VPTFILKFKLAGSIVKACSAVYLNFCRGPGYGTSLTAYVETPNGPWSVEGGLKWAWGDFPGTPYGLVRICFKFKGSPFGKTPIKNQAANEWGVTEILVEVYGRICMTFGISPHGVSQDPGAVIEFNGGFGVEALGNKGDGLITGYICWTNFDLQTWNYDSREYHVRYDVQIEVNTVLLGKHILFARRGNIADTGYWHTQVEEADEVIREQNQVMRQWWITLPGLGGSAASMFLLR
jgi:hypothetical protein